MFTLQPGQGLGFTGSKQIALGLGAIGEAGEIPEEPLVTTPGVGGGGGYARPATREPRYKTPSEKPLNKYLEQAKEEDEIVIQLITSLLTKGFFNEH